MDKSGLSVTIYSSVRPRKQTMNALINIAAMQIAWFACVLTAANNLPWIGTTVAVGVAALHLARARHPALELKLMVCALAMGFVLDSALASSGLVTFKNGELAAGLTTHWMLGLWLGFATTLNASLRWLMDQRALAIVFGALGGPLAYWSGSKLGAITLESQTVDLLAIGFGWALAMNILVSLVRRISANYTVVPAQA
jgi:hypothetical protein